MPPLSEILEATLEVSRALEELGIPYLLGGSLASSLYGIPRTTQDADLVVDLKAQDIPRLVAALEARFYIDSERALDAVRRRASFNVIHLTTASKVDLFILAREPFPLSEMGRRQRLSLSDAEGNSLFVASAEDVVVEKLRWYFLSGGASERQWNDVLGVLKVRGRKLDFSYLRRWAESLGIGNLLRKALADAGLPDG